MSYIALTDITDSVIRDFTQAGAAADGRVTTWLSRTDSEIEQLAIERAVTAAEIYTPLNYRIKEYAIAYLCFLVAQDCTLENSVDTPDNESYHLKLLWYKERCEYLKGQITGEMFRNTIQNLTPAQLIQTGIIYRA